MDTDRAHPRWSPDGSELAYISVPGGVQEVVAVPASGGTPRQITSTSQLVEEYPAWAQ